MTRFPAVTEGLPLFRRTVAELMQAGRQQSRGGQRYPLPPAAAFRMPVWPVLPVSGGPLEELEPLLAGAWQHCPKPQSSSRPAGSLSAVSPWRQALNQPAMNLADSLISQSSDLALF